MGLSLVQWGSVILSIVTLIFAILWMKKRPFKALWAVPVILFMVHSIIFYAILFFPHDNLSPTSINKWSSAKNIHGYITFAIYWVTKAYGRFGQEVKLWNL